MHFQKRKNIKLLTLMILQIICCKRLYETNYICCAILILLLGTVIIFMTKNRFIQNSVIRKYDNIINSGLALTRKTIILFRLKILF